MDKQDILVEDVKPKPAPNFTVRHIPSPVKVYTSNIGRSRVPSLVWEVPEWDLGEPGRIMDVDSFIKRAFDVKKILFFKEGYEFVGKTPLRARYIEKRLQQIEIATGIATPVLMENTVAALIRTSNAFWVKKRDFKASGGKMRTLPNGKQLQPVAGYFLLAPETVKIKRDEFGKIKKYVQSIHGKNDIEFLPENVIHFYWNKREGFSVGTPDITPVKDDARALRRIEENIELLIYQHLFPLFHYKVGTEHAPASTNADGLDEIQKVYYEIQNMPSDGCWVTSERHEIKAIGATVPPVDPYKAIEHFKQRIYTGLGVSPIDMGESMSASKSTALTLSRNLIDSTKAAQRIFGAQFYLEVIVELLQESTFPTESLFDEENAVHLKFKEIDIETMLARENHLVDMFLKNAITHDELRVKMGLIPFEGEGWPTGDKKQMTVKGEGDWAKTNYGIIERDRIILQSLDEPGTDASKAETESRTTTNNTKAAGGNSVANKNQPENQHGTRSSAKLNQDFIKLFNKQNSFTSALTKVQDYIEFYNLTNSNVDIEEIINKEIDSAVEDLFSTARHVFRISLKARQINSFSVGPKYLQEVKDSILRKSNLLKNQLVRLFSKYNNILDVSILTSLLKQKFYDFEKEELIKIFNYGSLLNIDSNIQLIPEDEAILKIKNTDAIIYGDLPETCYDNIEFQVEKGHK